MIILIIYTVTAYLSTGHAFNLPTSDCHRGHRSGMNNCQDRRRFIVQEIIPHAITLTTASSIILPTPAWADALLIDKSSPDIPAFKGDASDAKKRFQSAIKDVDSLIANYDEIAKSGGDNVRLYLGTQGVKSNMYGIVNVLKSLKEEADDIVEYTEALNEFEAYLFQADGAAYQSLFAEFSTAKITPESLLQIAKGDIVNMRKFMSELASQLGVDAR
ncbi:hypothetical protein ACHAWU_006330 [Discostella pseudostelligera]|uniref:Uncharacterized protein n=1 Tax=Discostella pseudostelligera TaxID=259834 RepID=A0ABD3M9Q0_9STRA